jgi:hypothetical protein
LTYRRELFEINKIRSPQLLAAHMENGAVKSTAPSDPA